MVINQQLKVQNCVSFLKDGMKQGETIFQEGWKDDARFIYGK